MCMYILYFFQKGWLKSVGMREYAGQQPERSTAEALRSTGATKAVGKKCLASQLHREKEQQMERGLGEKEQFIPTLNEQSPLSWTHAAPLVLSSPTCSSRGTSLAHLASDMAVMMVSRLGLAGVNLGHCYRFRAVVGARQGLGQWRIVVPVGVVASCFPNGREMETSGCHCSAALSFETKQTTYHTTLGRAAPTYFRGPDGARQES